jgi:hypothetical protein
MQKGGREIDISGAGLPNVFIPKNIWYILDGLGMENFGVRYFRSIVYYITILVYFTYGHWLFLWPFLTFFQFWILVCCTKENLATLFWTGPEIHQKAFSGRKLLSEMEPKKSH